MHLRIGPAVELVLINTMSAFAGTQLDEDIKSGTFTPASERESLEEEREFLRLLKLPNCYFWAAHPLDAVRIEGRLGESKRQMLEALERGISIVREGGIRRTSRVGTL